MQKKVYSICSFFRYSRFKSTVSRLAELIFDPVHLKDSQSPFNLCELVPACKKSIPSVHSWDTVKFRVQTADFPHSLFNMLTQESLNQLLAFLNLQQYAKSNFIQSIHSKETANFRVPWPNWPQPFLSMPTQKFFDHLLIYVNLYQHGNNLAISWICSGDMIDWKILQSDWLRTFWPISQEQKYS